MLDRRIHVEPLGRRLLAGDDDVDSVPTAQAMVGDIKEGIGVGRKVDPHDVSLLVDDMIDKSGILMAEAIMILAPDMRRQQIIERSDRPPPRHLFCSL